MRVVCVAADYLQSALVKQLAAELEKRGHEVKAFLGNGEAIQVAPGEMEEAIKASDLVFVTISNRNEDEVVAGLLAVQYGKPLCLDARDFSAFRMPAFSQLRSSVRILFRTTGDRTEEAQALFPNAEVLTVSSPFWEAWEHPKFSRSKVRQQFRVKRDECFVLCAGDKFPPDNILMIGCLLEATEKIQKMGAKVRLLFGLHPGDPLDRRFYEEMFKRTDIPVMMTGPNTMSLGDAVVGANVLINTVQTMGIQAAYQSIPSVNFIGIFTRTMLVRDQGEDVWDPCDNLGIAKAVRGSSVEDLAEAILSIYLEEGFSRMAAKRDEVFPAPLEAGRCIRLMADAMEKLV